MSPLREALFRLRAAVGRTAGMSDTALEELLHEPDPRRAYERAAQKAGEGKRQRPPHGGGQTNPPPPARPRGSPAGGPPGDARDLPGAGAPPPVPAPRPIRPRVAAAAIRVDLRRRLARTWAVGLAIGVGAGVGLLGLPPGAFVPGEVPAATLLILALIAVLGDAKWDGGRARERGKGTSR